MALFNAKSQLLTPTVAGGGGTPLAYDAIAGTGSRPALGGNISIAFTAAAGADVFLAIANDRPVTWSSVQYGSSTMTLVGSQNAGNNSAIGGIYLYRLAGGGTGSSLTVSASQGSAGAWVVANAISYTGVSSVGSPIYNNANTGLISSGSITCPSGDIILCIGGTGYDGTTTETMSSATGGTSRMATLNSNFLTSALFISDATTTTTFSATMSSGTMPSATIAVALSG